MNFFIELMNLFISPVIFTIRFYGFDFLILFSYKLFNAVMSKLIEIGSTFAIKYGGENRKSVQDDSFEIAALRSTDRDLVRKRMKKIYEFFPLAPMNILLERLIRS